MKEKKEAIPHCETSPLVLPEMQSLKRAGTGQARVAQTAQVKPGIFLSNKTPCLPLFPLKCPIIVTGGGGSGRDA